jgi:hypothetical protein
VRSRRGGCVAGDIVWASRSSSARKYSGRGIADERPSNRAEETRKSAEETPLSAEETHRWAVSCPRGYGVRGEERNYIVRY